MATPKDRTLFEIRTIDGTTRLVQLPSPPDSRIMQLKEKISLQFQIPAEFQQLVNSSGEVLEDSESIEGADLAELTLVISPEKPCTRLEELIIARVMFSGPEGPNELEQLFEAIRVFGQSRRLCRGDDRVLSLAKHCVAMVTNLLAHPDAGVRHSALELLPHIAEQGDENVITPVIDRLGNRDSAFRLTALQVLPHMAEKGDKRVLRSVASCLEDQHWPVRCAALDALLSIAENGDQCVITSAVALSEDCECAVRYAALEVLFHIAERGDAQVLRSVTARLEDCDGAVRRSALEILLCIAEEGDEGLITSIAACLEDSDVSVRRAALEVHAHLTETA